MQCVTPMFRRYRLGEYKKGKVVPRSEVMHELELNENNIRLCLDKINKSTSEYKYEKIPCQHCWACQLNYSAQWATRIMLEAQDYENNFFITLTYNDLNVPIAEKTEWDQYDKEIDGTITKTHHTEYNDGTWGYTLAPEHVQTFINSLRKEYERKGHKGIKYFYAGEYGTTTNRPHYHIILMNCPLDITKFYDTHIDENFKAHWKSSQLEKFWNKGIIDIAELEWSCAAYVARYCTKKLDFTQDKREYLKKGKLPEYIRMSKGIGFKYFEKHKDKIYKDDEIIMRTVKGNIGSIKPPKAFDRKFQEQDPEGFKKIKLSRKKAAERADAMLRSITDYTDLELIKINARKLETKMSLLPRAGDW